jgi:hypothetical protein
MHLKVLLKRLFPVVENIGLIPNHQFSFRQRHSTIVRINEALENKQHCSAAFLDSSLFLNIQWTVHSTYKMTSHTNCGDQTERNVPETKSKESYRVSLLYIVLQAD